MGRIAEQEIPEGGKVAASPIPEQNTVDPQQSDVDSFNLTAGPLRKGLRSGFNQVGAMANAFVSAVTSPLGLSQFAADRMRQAEEMVRFSESVAPEIRDSSQIKDFETLAQFVQGVIGQSVATTAPALAGAVIGRGAGMRGAYGGAAALSFPVLGGEQALRIKDAPGTPGEKLKNVLTTGAVNAAGESMLPGGVVTRVAGAVKKGAKGTVAGALAKGAAVEGVTEGAQEAVGQVMATNIDPNAKIDLGSIKENALQGAVGGAAIGGGGRLLESAAGAGADVTKSIKGKLQSKKDVDKALDVDPDVIDEFDDSDLFEDDTIETEADALSRITEKGEKSVETLKHFWEKVKANPEYQDLKDFATDPEQRAVLIEKLKERANELKIKPKIERAYKSVAAFGKGVEQGLSKHFGKKESKMRTKLDFVIFDDVVKRLTPEAQKNLTPDQKIALGNYVRHMAMYEWAKRDEVEGPGEPAFSDEGEAREQDRETMPRRLPDGIIELFGSEESAIDAINTTNKHLARLDLAKPRDFTKDVKKVSGIDKKRSTYFEDLVRRHMRSEIAADPESRERAVQELAPRIMNDEFDTLELKTKKVTKTEGKAGEKTKFAGRDYSAKGAQAARQARREQELDYVFGDNKNRFRAELETIRPRITREPDSFFQEEGTDLEGVEVADEQAEGGFRQATAEDIQKREGEGPLGDQRIGVPIRGLEQAKKLKAELEAQHEASLVTFKVESTKDGRYTVEATQRAADESFTDEEWAGIREKHHQTGLVKDQKTGKGGGVLTVKLRVQQKDADGKPIQEGVDEDGNPKYKMINVENAISLINLTSIMKRSTPQSDVTGKMSYEAEIFRRAMAKLLADPRVRTEDGSPFSKSTGEQLKQKADGTWDLPDNTPVSASRKINPETGQREYEIHHYGDIKRAEMPQNPTAVKLRENIRATEGPAQWGAKDKLGFPRPLNKRAKAIDALSAYYDNQQADRQYADEWESDALEFADGNPERLEAEADRIREKADKIGKEGKARRLYGYMQAAANRLDAEAERLRMGGAEELGEGGAITDIQKQIADRPDTRVRRVEGDTGIPLAGVGREGPGGSLTFGKTNKEPSHTNQLKGKYQAKVITPEEKEQGRAENRAIEQAKRGKQTPSAVNDKGPLVDKEKSKPIVLPIELEADYRAWLAKNPGKDVMAYLDDKIAYTGKGKKALELKAKAKEFAYEIETAQFLRGSKKTTMNISLDKPLTDEQKAEAKAYIEKVLGPKAKTLFANMTSAGESIKDKDGIETIAIANLAMDHMGVARHEAAHILMSRLIKADPKAAQTLLAAAGSPTIVTRLRSLLRDHPRALAQLSEAEERLAYMYQFWAAKKLTVGPNTNGIFESIKGFFRKIAGLWSETFTNVETSEKAEKIFELFDSGRLSEPNTVREVLRAAFPKSAYERATELMGPVHKFLTKAFFTADGIIRDMKVPALTEVMDKFFTPVGQQDKGPGFLQTRYLELNKRLNVLNKILDGKSEEHMRLALEALHNETDAMNAEVQKTVDGINELLREVFDYMTADKKNPVRAVVWSDDKKKYVEHELGFVEKYFPRYYDRQKIFEERDAFERALVKQGGLSTTEAKSVAENILRTSKQAPDENDSQAGLTFYAPNSQDRKLKIPTSVVAPWLHKDLRASMYSYFNYSTRRAEYAKRFGNQGQVIEEAAALATAQGATKDQINTFNQAVMALEGSLGHDIAPELKQIMGGVMTYQNFRLLPLALFTSLADPIGIAVRGGGLPEAFNAFVRGLRGIVKEHKDANFDLATTIGTISVNNDGHMLADAFGTQYLTEWQRKANSFFFRFNGMESWNRQMRVAATGAGAKFIIKHAAGYNEHSDRYLRELGLQASDVKVENGELVLNDKVKYAIAQWVDGAILRPNAAIRPIWMSDPHYMLLAHLKQFTYSFQKIVVARVVHEVENGNYTPALSLLSYVPMLMAIDVMKYMLTPGGGDDENLRRMGLGGLLWHGTQRAGIFGPAQYGLDAYGDLGHAKLPISSILGPTADQLLDFGYAVAGKGDVATELKKAVPGYVFVR